MQQDDQTHQLRAASPTVQPPSIGLGPQIAITAGVITVLATLNTLVQLWVTDGIGLSLWVMVVVFALLTALAGRESERATRGDLFAMWFAAFFAWLFAAVYALADLTGISPNLLFGVVAVALYGRRWLDVRRGRRASLSGRLLERSSPGRPRG